MRKRIVLPAIIIMVVAVAAGWLFTALSGGEELIIATSTDYPPFSYVDDAGNLAGFDYEYGELLCQRMEARCQWQSAPFEFILDRTAKAEFDLAVNSHTRTPYREQLVRFSDPYYYSFGQFVKRAGSDAQVEPGRVVAVQAETIYEKYLGSPGFAQLRVSSFPNQEDAFLAVSEGRADLTIADDVITYLAINRSPFLAGGKLGPFEPVEGRIIPEPGTAEFEALGTGEIGIIVPMQNAHLLPKINRAIKEINAGEEIAEISRGYFGRNIVERPGSSSR